MQGSGAGLTGWGCCSVEPEGAGCRLERAGLSVYGFECKAFQTRTVSTTALCLHAKFTGFIVRDVKRRLFAHTTSVVCVNMNLCENSF